VVARVHLRQRRRNLRRLSAPPLLTGEDARLYRFSCRVLRSGASLGSAATGRAGAPLKRREPKPNDDWLKSSRAYIARDDFFTPTRRLTTSRCACEIPLEPLPALSAVSRYLLNAAMCALTWRAASAAPIASTSSRPGMKIVAPARIRLMLSRMNTGRFVWN